MAFAIYPAASSHSLATSGLRRVRCTRQTWLQGIARSTACWVFNPDPAGSVRVSSTGIALVPVHCCAGSTKVEDLAGVLAARESCCGAAHSSIGTCCAANKHQLVPHVLP